MKKITSILLILCTAIIFSGCPYESVVPINNTPEPVSRLLLGNWTAKDENGSANFMVTKTDNYNYKIIENDGQRMVTYVGFLSKVGDVLYLNLKGTTDTDTSYGFAKLIFNKNATQVTLSFISDDLKEKFKSAEELKSYIQQNQSKDNFFDQEPLLFTKSN